MPKLKKQMPKMCTCRGRCHVWHNGKRVNLGKAGSEAERNYRKFINELTKGVPHSSVVPLPDGGARVGIGAVPVSRLCADYLKERQGKVSPTQWDNEKNVVAVMVSLFGDMDAATFDINCLRAVRNEFIQKGLVRQKINWRIQIAQRVFRWGASYKVVPVSVHQELKTLIPLKKRIF